MISSLYSAAVNASHVISFTASDPTYGLCSLAKITILPKQEFPLQTSFVTSPFMSKVATLVAAITKFNEIGFTYCICVYIVRNNWSFLTMVIPAVGGVISDASRGNEML